MADDAQDWRIVAPQPGGPEVLRRESIAVGDPGPGQARVRHEAIGVNFIDVYFRTGLYPQAPGGAIGSEAAGVVEAVGADVMGLAPGDRVTWLSRPPGTYASRSLIDAASLIPLPDDIDSEIAAAATLKGLTAWMLAERCAKAGPGSMVLVHAAAGGVGSIVVPWLKAIGATVIAHTGNAAKAERARALGADHALCCPFDDLAAEVRARTDGRGVDAVLDGVGAASWTASLQSTAKRGLIVSYGNASGPVPPVGLLSLGTAGSLFVTRPTLFDYVDTLESRAAGAARLFEMLRSKSVTIEIGRRYPLADAAEAHRALEARQTTGSTILLP